MKGEGEILERGGPKSLKMAFEYPFQSFSYKSFVNIPPKGRPGIESIERALRDQKRDAKLSEHFPQCVCLTVSFEFNCKQTKLNLFGKKNSAEKNLYQGSV